MLLNTSLNKGGDPIMGSQVLAINMLRDCDLDVVCIGGKIVNKSDVQPIDIT